MSITLKYNCGPQQIPVTICKSALKCCHSPSGFVRAEWGGRGCIPAEQRYTCWGSPFRTLPRSSQSASTQPRLGCSNSQTHLGASALSEWELTPSAEGELDTSTSMSIGSEDMPKPTTRKNENEKHLPKLICLEMGYQLQL